MFFSDYFKRLENTFKSVDLDEMEMFAKMIIDTDLNGNKIFVVGNGGSASIANHAVIDFLNAAKIKAMSFTDPGLITCFSNDYGYENWVVKALESYAKSGDIIVLISSSGESKNIINAAKYANENNMKVVTFSGFSSDNPLKKEGDINFWVNSCEYNNVEIVHQIWLLAAIDKVISIKIPT